MMKPMDELMDIVCNELEEYGKRGDISAADLDTVYKLTIIKEKLLRIEEIEGNLGYSHGDWNVNRSYGRQSRNYMREPSRRGYSYAESRDELMGRISEMMEGGGLNERERQSLKRAMDELR